MKTISQTSLTTYDPGINLGNYGDMKITVESITGKPYKTIMLKMGTGEVVLELTDLQMMKLGQALQEIADQDQADQQAAFENGAGDVSKPEAN